MAITTKSFKGDFGARFGETVRLAFAAVRAIAVNMNHRRQAKSLIDLPDYLLQDLGLRRDDIHDALMRDWRVDPTYRLALTAANRTRRHCNG